MISTESIVVERERAKCMHQYNICIDQIQQPQKIKTWRKPVTAGVLSISLVKGSFTLSQHFKTSQLQWTCFSAQLSYEKVQMGRACQK